MLQPHPLFLILLQPHNLFLMFIQSQPLFLMLQQHHPLLLYLAVTSSSITHLLLQPHPLFLIFAQPHPLLLYVATKPTTSSSFLLLQTVLWSWSNLDRLRFQLTATSSQPLTPDNKNIFEPSLSKKCSFENLSKIFFTFFKEYRTYFFF